MKAKNLIFAAITLFFAVGCTGPSNKSQTDNNQITDNMENTQNEQKEAVVYLTKNINFGIKKTYIINHYKQYQN